MNDIKSTVEGAAKFYHQDIMTIDYKQTEFCYRSLKPFFRGTVACELGPATGYMTKNLLDDFEQLDVIEGAKDLLDAIPDNPKLKKYHSLFEDFQPSRKYDTIIMSHVLEHIKEPVALLSTLKTWLAPGGALLVAVPNALSFHRMAAVEMGLLNKETDLNDRDKELGHYRVYDMATLTSHAKQAGLNITHSGGIFLKFLSNAQIEKICTDQMLEAYYKLSERFGENGAEIYIVCEL
jgi:SAM-dependent methyltransferase